MTTKNASIDAIALQSQDDWEAWNREFMSRAVASDLWKHIDPEDYEDFLTRPEKPGFELFRKRADLPLTRSASQASTHTATPELTTSEPAETVEDLTTEGRQQYNLKWSMFQYDAKIYELQRTAIKDLKTWIHKTVSEDYIHTSCSPIEDLRIWYQNLKENIGIDDEKLKADARDKYRKAVAPIKAAKGLDKWITQWEKAMSEAKAKRIGEVSDIYSWFDDFTLAVQDVMPSWIPAYKMNKKTDVQNGNLSYRTVGNDFRDQLRMLAKSSNKSVKIAKGSFGPTFPGGNEDGSSPEPEKAEDSQKDPKKNKNTRGSRNKRKRVSTVVDPVAEPSRVNQVCKACGMRHLLTECFYALPKKAPPKFKENPVVRRLVDLNIANDITLKEEIQRLNKQKTSNEED
jgi:hypothetical protein